MGRCTTRYIRSSCCKASALNNGKCSRLVEHWEDAFSRWPETAVVCLCVFRLSACVCQCVSTAPLAASTDYDITIIKEKERSGRQRQGELLHRALEHILCN